MPDTWDMVGWELWRMCMDIDKVFRCPTIEVECVFLRKKDDDPDREALKDRLSCDMEIA